MSLSLQPYKGARDFYPEDKRVQKYIFHKLRQTVESFGYAEYDAPILEPLELYASKTSQEIVSEQTYSFTDRGGRQVTLRPEMTPSVTRLVAARKQHLNYPLRLYSIPNLWRYERPQRGRLREHYQLNVDIFGVAGIAADHEIILVTDSILKSFGAKPDMYAIKLNSRKLMQAILGEFLMLPAEQSESIMRLIDRFHKMKVEEFFAALEAMLTSEQREQQIGQRLARLLAIQSIDELSDDLKKHPSVLELKQLMALLQANHVSNVEFDITLMRGFDYYTDIVFEVFDKHPENNRSMFGGGRYDGLMEVFGVEPVPTVGFGMGDVTLLNFLIDHKLLPKLQPEVDLSVLLVGDTYAAAQPKITYLREEGLRVNVDNSGRKLDAQLKSAIKSGARYVIVVGQDEIANDRFKLKDLMKKTEEEYSLDRMISIVAAARKKYLDSL